MMRKWIFTKKGVRYGFCLTRFVPWKDVKEAGFYLEKVKVRDVHYMNFSNHTYLTKPSRKTGVWVLWLVLLAEPLQIKSPTTFARVFKQKDNVFIPIVKKQGLPSRFEKKEREMAQKMAKMSDIVPFYVT